MVFTLYYTVVDVKNLIFSLNLRYIFYHLHNGALFMFSDIYQLLQPSHKTSTPRVGMQLSGATGLVLTWPSFQQQRKTGAWSRDVCKRNCIAGISIKRFIFVSSYQPYCDVHVVCLFSLTLRPDSFFFSFFPISPYLIDENLAPHFR